MVVHNAEIVVVSMDLVAAGSNFTDNKIEIGIKTKTDLAS